MIEQHYTTAEVAAALGCSTDTVLRLAARGELRSVYVTSERRYSESAINEYLERQQARRPVMAAVVPLRETPASTTRRTG